MHATSLAVLSLALAPTAQDPSTTDKLASRIVRELEKSVTMSTPGAAVVVTRAGKIVVEQAVGLADMEHRVPITVESAFHIASDAKRFTAASICRLAERGKLDLQDPVTKHIPEMSQLGVDVSIEQLLCHTSGLRDQWSLLAMAGWRPEDIVTHDQVLGLLYRQRATNFAPGALQMYSNSGYTLLAEVVSRVANVPFAEFVSREFFQPCGMSKTTARASVGTIVPGRVTSYVRNRSGAYVRRPVQYQVFGATSVLSTARDLARWIEAVHDRKVLSEFEIGTMLAPRRLPDGQPMTYAFGLFEHRMHGRTLIGHGGGDGGFRSYVLRVPDEKLGIIVLANTPEVEPNGLAHRIMEWALGIEPEPSSDKAELAAKPPDLDSLVGSYRGPEGRLVTVRRYLDRLRLWENGATMSDFAWKDSAFADTDGRTLSFENASLLIKQGARDWRGRKAPKPTAEQLRVYEGSYRSAELAVDYTVVARDDHLVLKTPRGAAIRLTPSGLGFFDGSSWYCNEVRFTFDDDRSIPGLFMSSSRAFDVTFQRQ